MRNKLRKTATFACTALLILCAGCGQNGERTYKKAMKAWKKGDTTKARGLMEQSINKLQNTEQKALAYNNLGLILWDLNAEKEASKAFSNARNAAGTITGATLNLAIAQFKQNNLQQAEISLNQFLDKEPENKTALELLNALTMTQLKQRGIRIEQVEQNLQQIITSYPDYTPALFNLASTYDHLLAERAKAAVYYQVYLLTSKNKGKMSQQARMALERNPLDPQTPKENFDTGKAFYELGQHDQATQYLKETLTNRRFPQAMDARYMLCKIYIMNKQWAAAQGEAAEVAVIDPERAENMRREIHSAQNR